MSLIRYGETLLAGLEGMETLIDRLERGVKPSEVMVATRFRAIRTRPGTLGGLLERVLREMKDMIDAGVDLPERRLILDTYFSIQFFRKVTDELDPGAYVTTFAVSDENEPEIKLLCLDASDFLSQQLAGRHAAVFLRHTQSDELLPVFDPGSTCLGTSPDPGSRRSFPAGKPSGHAVRAIFHPLS